MMIKLENWKKPESMIEQTKGIWEYQVIMEHGCCCLDKLTYKYAIMLDEAVIWERILTPRLIKITDPT